MRLRAWKYLLSGESGTPAVIQNPPRGDAFDVIVNHDVIFADDAHAAAAFFVVADEEIAVNNAAIAVTQSQHSGAFVKSVAAINVFARFVGDDFDFAVATVEQIARDRRARILHRILAVTDANRLAAVFAQRRARPEMVEFDQMIVRLLVHLDLHRRRIAGFASEITVIHAIIGAAQMNEILGSAADNRAFGQTAMVAFDRNRVATSGGILEHHAAEKRHIRHRSRFLKVPVKTTFARRGCLAP